MSNKHTPGPWEIPHLADDNCMCDCSSVVEQRYAGGICHIHVDNGIKSISDGGNDCPPLDEAKANAHLIAAAPELLEALEVFVEITEGRGAVKLQAIAAITKAKGEKQ